VNCLFNNMEKVMKRLAMLAATGIMAFMISACGDNAPQKPEVQADDMQSQVQQPAVAAPAAPEAPAAPVTQPAQPSDEAMADAAVQE
jgi:hypothetical protein